MKTIDKINCKIKGFGNYTCRSKGNAEKCGGVFYKCADLNSKRYYKEAIEHFKLVEQEMIAYNENLACEDFDKLKDRKKCNGDLLKTDRKTQETSKENINEDFICRCYYLCYTGKCTINCPRRFNSPDGEYQIVDYQMPPKKGNCGKIDLVITDNTNIYLTEVKPPVGNDETLLRMICEILTHTSYLKLNKHFHKYINDRHKINIDESKVYPAIMFFSDSKQLEEYENCEKEILEIINKNNIKVFECNAETKRIYKKN